jgi:hypothetical protein
MLRERVKHVDPYCDAASVQALITAPSIGGYYNRFSRCKKARVVLSIAATNRCEREEGKDRMRARGVSSPDEWDAVALTFAEPVSEAPSNFYRVLEYPKYAVA